MEKYKVCPSCHVAFDARLEQCPSCGKKVPDLRERRAADSEGSGRAFRAGGAACDLCPHCYGSADWCPMLDD